jgi:hypothetical protein
VYSVGYLYNLLKLYNTLVLPTFLYGSENWTLTASHRRRIEAAEMKLLKPLAGHTFNNHKTNDPTRRELQTECILDRIDEYRRNWLLHPQRMPHNRRGKLSYLAPLGSEKISAPYFKQRFFRVCMGGTPPPPRLSNTAPPSQTPPLPVPRQK